MGDDFFDVAIVGAGPAGSVAAFAAARRGLRVALIDRQTFPRDKACGDGIGPAVVHIARQLGFEAIFDKCTPIDAITVYGPDGSTLESAIPSIEGETVQGYVMPRLEFDNRLLNLALQAGAHDFSGVKFMDSTLTDHARGVELRNTAGTSTRISTRLLIGADGAYSTVRSKLKSTPPPAVQST